MLSEEQYEKFLSPKTIELLKGKSTESRKEMLGNSNLFQTMLMTKQLLNLISVAEKNHIPQLEQLAVQIVEEAYPVLNDLNIVIDAKIVTLPEITGMLNADNEEEEQEEVPDTIKRRLINAISQGASIRGSFIFNLFREHLSELDEEMVSNYNKVLKLAFGIYDDEQAIALLLAMLAQQKKAAGGAMEVDITEENDETKITIKARALNFPMLVYEIIKGLYELVSLQGFGPNLDRNNQIVQQVDKLSNEPEDLRYGKFIYDAIHKIFSDSDYWEDTRVREYFLGELYKLEDVEFIEFIENLINDSLTKDQKWWIASKFRDISAQIKNRNTSSFDNEDDDEEGSEFAYVNR